MILKVISAGVSFGCGTTILKWRKQAVEPWYKVYTDCQLRIMLPKEGLIHRPEEAMNFQSERVPAGTQSKSAYNCHQGFIQDFELGKTGW